MDGHAARLEVRAGARELGVVARADREPAPLAPELAGEEQAQPA